MNQFRREPKRSWSVASTVALFGCILGWSQTSQDRLFAQGPAESPYGMVRVPTNPAPAAVSPYGMVPVPANPRAVSPYGIVSVPANPATVSQPQMSPDGTQPTARVADTTVYPAQMGQASSSGESSGATTAEPPVDTDPTVPIIVLGHESGSMSASDVSPPSTTSEPPLEQTPEPLSVDVATPLPSPATQDQMGPGPDSASNTQAVDQTPAIAGGKETEGATVPTVAPTVTTTATTKTEPEKPTAVATTVTKLATPGTGTDKPAPCESHTPAKQPDSLAAQAKDKEPGTNRPAGADEGGTAVLQAGPAPGSWADNVTARQLLIVLIVAVALGTITGLCAMILLSRRRGGVLPDETVELINQTLRVWRSHLTTGQPATERLPRSGSEASKRSAPEPEPQAPDVRSAADSRGKDDIVQNILKENRSLRSDANSSTNAAAPGPGVIQVFWEPFSTGNRTR